MQVSAHLQTNNIITNSLIHYRNTNSVHIKRNSSVNHCTVTHIPRPTILSLHAQKITTSKNSTLLLPNLPL